MAPATSTAGESHSPATPAAGAPAGGSALRTGTPETATNGARPAAVGGRQRGPLCPVALLRARWAGAELRHLSSCHRSGRTVLARRGGPRVTWFEEHLPPQLLQTPPKHQEEIICFLLYVPVLADQPTGSTASELPFSLSPFALSSTHTHSSYSNPLPRFSAIAPALPPTSCGYYLKKKFLLGKCGVSCCMPPCSIASPVIGAGASCTRAERRAGRGPRAEEAVRCATSHRPP